MLRILRAEFRKNIIEMKTYYPDQIADFIIKFIIFVAFFVGFGKSRINETDFCIGYLFWMISSQIISEASVNISFEKQVGTIEQLLIKPYKMDIILAVRTFISFMVSFAKYLLLYIIIYFLFGIYINISVELVIICVISLIGFLGLGIALSGITMIFSKTASFETIISYLLLLLSGSVISYDNINHSVFNVMKLCPFVYEIYLAQNIVTGESLESGQTIYLLAINVIMLLLGMFVFRAIHKYVTRVGISNDY